MKKIYMLIITALLLVTASESFASDTAKMTELLKLARENNPVIYAQKEKIERAKAAVDEATARRLPSLTAAYAGIWNEAPVFDMSGTLGPIYRALDNLGQHIAPPKVNNPLADKKIFAAALLLTQTIYSGGSLPALQSAAKLAYQAAQAETDRTVQTVEANVRIAYFNHGRALAKLKVAEEAVSLAKEHQKQAEKLHAEGVVAKSDVLRSQVAVADADLNLIRAENAVELTKIALDRIVAAEYPQNLLSDEIGAEAEITADENIAFASRPELKMYDLYSKQAAKIAKAEAGQALPQILGFGALTKIGNTGWPDGDAEWHAGVVATWKLFDSGQIKAKTEQAKFRSKELLYLLQDKKNEVRMEVKQALLNQKAAKSRLIVAQRQEVKAEEDYRIAKLRYRENVGSNLDMLDARLAYTNSKSELIDAKYDIAVAEANIIYALGK